MFSKDGNYLGRCMPDEQGNKYVINLVAISGTVPEPVREKASKKWLLSPPDEGLSEGEVAVVSL